MSYSGVALDWFNEMSTETMNGTNGHAPVHEEKNQCGGIAPGLVGDFIDPHLKTQRDYESEYAKLALKGGHKGIFFSIFLNIFWTFSSAFLVSFFRCMMLAS